MDDLRSCFTTLMWLWGPDRPPVPVRWFFAEEGAKLFPYAHSFWNVDWEMDKGYKGDNDLIGERGKYANGSTFVHYPGQHFHGPAQAFIDGGRWGIDEPMTTGPDGAIAECRIPAGSPPGWLVMSGGQGQGGITHQCGLLGYGTTGGQAQGGSHHVCTGQWISLSGGQKQGGTHAFTNGYSLRMTGGQKQGGAEAFAPTAYLVMSGGQIQGGTLAIASGYSLLMSGGQIQGGAEAFAPTAYLGMSGGQIQGGTEDMSGDAGGGGSCGPVPTVVGATEGSQGTGTTNVSYPAGIAGGDLLLMSVWANDATAVFVVPSGWLLLDSAADGAGSSKTAIYYKVFPGILTAGATTTGPSGAAMKSNMIAVRGSGAPVSGGFGADVGGPVTAPGMDVGSCPALLIMVGGTLSGGSPFNTPSGMTDQAPNPATIPLSMWSETPVGPGASGDRSVSPDDPNEWAACLVACPPA